MVYVDCRDITEAEGYVRDYPRDAHGFATSGMIDVPYTTQEETRARLRSLLTDAGYTWDEEEEAWARDGYIATASDHDDLRHARIFVYREAEPQAWAAGVGGYLHPGDRPDA
jgi:hypothetical protein